MTYVKVDNVDTPTVITEFRGPSRLGELKLSDGALVRPSTGETWNTQPGLAKLCGFLPVTVVPPPPDTATTTHDRSIELVAGVPTVVWTERPKTQSELDNYTRRVRNQEILIRAETAISRLQTIEGQAASRTDAANLAEANTQLQGLADAVGDVARMTRYIIANSVIPEILSDDAYTSDLSV